MLCIDMADDRCEGAGLVAAVVILLALDDALDDAVDEPAVKCGSINGELGLFSDSRFSSVLI
jgi:hypothetical protein